MTHDVTRALSNKPLPHFDKRHYNCAHADATQNNYYDNDNVDDDDYASLTGVVGQEVGEEILLCRRLDAHERRQHVLLLAQLEDNWQKLDSSAISCPWHQN